jgi:hypothetical protein
MDTNVRDMLSFDPLDTAERLLGRNTEASTALGMMLAINHNRAKREMLVSMDDTTLSNTVERYLRICGELGFEHVLCLPFEGRSWGNEPAPDEAFHVLAHRDGMLLVFDTFHTMDVNSAKVYYNWRPRPDLADAYRFTSSGGWHNYDAGRDAATWVGDHDAREAIRHKIQGLRDNGEFLARWQERPFLWLLHHMDTKQEGYDHDAINAERIGMLPGWVREMITPEGV